jgi:hypothetical protein
MSGAGNPVKFGDGCATVTGDKLPRPLAKCWEGGSAVRSPESGYRPDMLVQVSPDETNFSVREKDEASPLNQF